MTPELYGLEEQLKQNARAKATGLGMDEQFAAAEALRDAPRTEAYKGYVSPMSIIADTIGQNTGKRQLRELAPQRAANRMAQAEGATALPMFQERKAQRAVELAAANRAEDQGLAASKRAYDIDQAEKAAALDAENLDYNKGAFTDVKPMWTQEGKEVQVGYDDRKLPVDTNTKQPMDITQLLSENPALTKSTVAKNAATGKGAGDPYSTTAENEGRGFINNLGKINEIRTISDTFDEDTITKLNSGTEIAKKLVAGGIAGFIGPDAKTFVRGQIVKDPKIRAYAQRLAALSSDERHALFGGALSEREAQSADEFIASVMALPFSVQMDRLSRLQKTSETGINTIDLSSGGTRFGDVLKNSEFNVLYPPEAPVPVKYPDDPAKQQRFEDHVRSKQK